MAIYDFCYNGLIDYIKAARDFIQNIKPKI